MSLGRKNNRVQWDKMAEKESIKYTENSFLRLQRVPLASNHDALLPEDDKRPLHSKSVQRSL
jgi:hypothetical protein